jgi:hypothetical protein
MNALLQQLHWRNLMSAAKGLSLGAWLLIGIMVALLIWTIMLAEAGWKSAGNVDVPDAGYVAMAFGVLFSLVVGTGLMALVFYSSRAGYDEPAKLVEKPALPPADRDEH